MKPTDPTRRPPAPQARRSLLLVLGLAIAAFLVTLPWQRQQWEKTRRLQEETRVQESRLRDVAAQQKREKEVQTRLQTAPATNLSARLDAARAALSHGDTSGGAKLAAEAEKIALADPAYANDAALFTDMAGLFQQAGWIDRALANAQHAFRLAPNDLGAVMRLALLEAQLGWQDECRQHIALAQRIAPNAAESHLALALLNDQIGARNESERELMTADRLRPGDPNISLLLFQNRMDHHRYDAALSTIEAAALIHPANPNLIYARVQALIERALSRAGGVDAAGIQAGLEAARKYQRIAPNDPSIHFLTGKALLGLGDEAGAAHEWEELYKLRPNQSQLALNLGRLLVRRGDRARGKRLLEDGERVRAAEAEFNRLSIAAGATRTDPEPHRRLARWCRQRRRFSHAILEWEQVLRINPADAEALRERDKCLIQRVPETRSL